MITDLVSAIKYCEEEAEEQEKMGERNYDDDCLECAKEYHQFAKWLRELKACRRYSVLPCYLMESKISEEVNADEDSN